MLRTTFAAVFTLVASAAMGIAGGVVEQPMAPVTAAPAAVSADFSGTYFGLAYGNVDGSLTETASLVIGGSAVVDDDIDSDQSLGIFGGYNVQRGNLVYGAELGAWAVSTPLIGADELSSLTDFRGRVGFAAGNALFYGAVGWSWGTWENTNSGADIGVDGHSLGLGVEYNVTDRLFVGLDYTARDMDGSNGDLDLDMDVDTLALRGGFRF